MNITIRHATKDDVPLIFSFIQKKAAFDHAIGAFNGVLQVTEEKLHQTLFCEHPYSHVLFTDCSGVDVGFAVYGFRYSSFAGQPNLWLDDLYIIESYRSRGIGNHLMNYLAGIATDHHCTHLGWTADVRNNRGLEFYHRLGAQIIMQQGNRCFLKWVPFL